MEAKVDRVEENDNACTMDGTKQTSRSPNSNHEKCSKEIVDFNYFTSSQIVLPDSISLLYFIFVIIKKRYLEALNNKPIDIVGSENFNPM